MPEITVFYYSKPISFQSIFKIEFFLDFTVKIYNARFLGPPDTVEPLVGDQNILQGQAIGRRLDCGAGRDSIFLEFRKFGRLVNMTDAILANNCKFDQEKDTISR